MLLQILQEIINDFDQIDSVARMVQDADSLISRILNPIKEVEDITKMLKDAEYILTRILNPVRSSSSLYEIKKIDPRECGNIFKFIINIIIFKILDNNNELVDIIDNLIDSSVDFISVKKRYTCSCLCQIS